MREVANLVDGPQNILPMGDAVLSNLLIANVVVVIRAMVMAMRVNQED